MLKKKPSSLLLRKPKVRPNQHSLADPNLNGVEGDSVIFPLLNLPSELIYLITTHLPMRDLRSIACTSKKLHDLALPDQAGKFSTFGDRISDSGLGFTSINLPRPTPNCNSTLSRLFHAFEDANLTSWDGSLLRGCSPPKRLQINIQGSACFIPGKYCIEIGELRGEGHCKGHLYEEQMLKSERII